MRIGQKRDREKGKVEEGEQQVNKEEKGQGDGNERKKERGLKSCPFLGGQGRTHAYVA